jgi:hypothetical protein
LIRLFQHELDRICERHEREAERETERERARERERQTERQRPGETEIKVEGERKVT